MSEKILEKIEERYKRGEISRETYEAIVNEYQNRSDEEKEEERDDTLKGGIGISGVGKTGEVKGEYLRISGSGKVEGNVDVREVTISGSAKIEGNVKTKVMGCSGACSVEGDIHTASLTVSGSMNCEGNVNAEHIAFSGGVRVEGDIFTEVLESSGGTKVEGKIRAKKAVKIRGTLKTSDIDTGIFDGEGRLLADGRVHAEDFGLEMDGSSEVESIDAEKIHIKPGIRGGMLSRIFGRSGGLMKAGEIRGKEIDIENTNADLVEGDKVNIGPGCRIKVLRAQNATIHESSKVIKRE